MYLFVYELFSCYAMYKVKKNKKKKPHIYFDIDTYNIKIPWFGEDYNVSRS